MEDDLEKVNELKEQLDDLTNKPLWERLPDRFGEKYGQRVKICRLPECEEVHYAKGLCNRHYLYAKAGKLDPQTGGMTKANQNLNADEIVLPQMKEITNWVYVAQSQEFVRKTDMFRLTYKAAVAANGNILKTLVLNNKIKTYDGYKFQPYRTDFAESSDEPIPADDSFFNMYRPDVIVRANSIENSDLPNELSELFRCLAGSEAQELQRWLANLFRHPGRAGTALILRGMHGSGKGTLATILQAIYSEYWGRVGLNEIENDFTSWVENKICMIGEEITFGGSKAQIRTINHLKKLVAGDRMFVNRKGVPQYETNICARWIFCTNAKLPFLIERGERRYWAFDSADKLDKEIGKRIADNAKHYGQKLVNHLHFKFPKEESTWEPYENATILDIKDRSEEFLR